MTSSGTALVTNTVASAQMPYVYLYVKFKSSARITIRMPDKAKKQKLTLSIDKEVVEAAKKLDINISEITEKILRSFTLPAVKVESDVLYEKYKQLFNTMMPALRKYNTSVEVGSVWDDSYTNSFPIILLNDGTFYIEAFERAVKDIQEFYLSDFYPPKQILSNFILALSEGAERQQQTLTELEMAKRIIEAITGPQASSGKIPDDILKKVPQLTNKEKIQILLYYAGRPLTIEEIKGNAKDLGVEERWWHGSNFKRDLMKRNRLLIEVKDARGMARYRLSNVARVSTKSLVEKLLSYKTWSAAGSFTIPASMSKTRTPSPGEAQISPETMNARETDPYKLEAFKVILSKLIEQASMTIMPPETIIEESEKLGITAVKVLKDMMQKLSSSTDKEPEVVKRELAKIFRRSLYTLELKPDERLKLHQFYKILIFLYTAGRPLTMEEIKKNAKDVGIPEFSLDNNIHELIRRGFLIEEKDENVTRYRLGNQASIRRYAT